jgi:hypothetical protein
VDDFRSSGTAGVVNFLSTATPGSHADAVTIPSAPAHGPTSGFANTGSPRSTPPDCPSAVLGVDRIGHRIIERAETGWVGGTMHPSLFVHKCVFVIIPIALCKMRLIQAFTGILEALDGLDDLRVQPRLDGRLHKADGRALVRFAGRD